MCNLLEGKVAIITGAGQGIGRATAELFAHHGAIVASADIREDTAQETVEQIRSSGGSASAHVCDVTDLSAVGSMVGQVIAQWSRVDVLVNNAGASWGSIDLDVSEADWSGVLNLNLTGQFNCIRSVVPQMKAQRYGKLVGVASDAGRFRSYGASYAYAAAKAGVHGLHRRLAEELGPWNITCNSVSPGNVLTEEGREFMELPVMRGLLQDCPLGRWTEPEELASALLFLASDLSSHVTGVTMSVNGGWHMVW